MGSVVLMSCGDSSESTSIELLSAREIDFGVIEHGARASGAFEFINRTTAVKELKLAFKSCSCLEVSSDALRLDPDRPQSATLTLTASRTGEIKVVAAYEVRDEPSNLLFALRLSAFVLPKSTAVPHELVHTEGDPGPLKFLVYDFFGGSGTEEQAPLEVDSPDGIVAVPEPAALTELGNGVIRRVTTCRVTVATPASQPRVIVLRCGTRPALAVPIRTIRAVDVSVIPRTLLVSDLNRQASVVRRLVLHPRTNRTRIRSVRIRESSIGGIELESWSRLADGLALSLSIDAQKLQVGRSTHVLEIQVGEPQWLTREFDIYNRR